MVTRDIREIFTYIVIHVERITTTFYTEIIHNIILLSHLEIPISCACMNKKIIYLLPIMCVYFIIIFFILKNSITCFSLDSTV